MRVVVAPGRYAGTLTAAEAAQALARGWSRRVPRDVVVARPVDGAGSAAELTELGRELARADLVVVGEGRFDARSLDGTASVAVAQLAQRIGVRCLLLAGQIEIGRPELAAVGIEAAYAVADLAGSVEEAMAAPGPWLEELAAHVAGEWSRG